MSFLDCISVFKVKNKDIEFSMDEHIELVRSLNGDDISNYWYGRYLQLHNIIVTKFEFVEQFKFTDKCPDYKNAVACRIFIKSREKDIENINLAIKEAKNKIKDFEKWNHVAEYVEIEMQIEN